MQDSAARCYSGQVLQDSYRLESLVGRGGMGEVWRASHLRLSAKTVAIKVIYLKGGTLIERLRREALIMSGLQHPHIVHVEDLLTLPSGEPFMVMELLDGQPLSDRLAQGSIDHQLAEQWLCEAADAIESAHLHGVVHRDLKPDNIFLCRGETLKVLDFGISSLLGGETLSGEGALIGTPFYMSPEQARGERVDARSDLFSLGLIAIELISGQRAISGESLHAALHQVTQFRAPPAPVGYSPERWAQLVKATSLTLEERPESVRAWVRAAFQRELPHRSLNQKLKAEITGSPLSQPLDATLESVDSEGVTIAADAEGADTVGADTVGADTVGADTRGAHALNESPRHETIEGPSSQAMLSSESLERSSAPQVKLEAQVKQLSPLVKIGALLGVILGVALVVWGLDAEPDPPVSTSSPQPSSPEASSELSSTERLPAWYLEGRSSLRPESGERWVARSALKIALARDDDLESKLRAQLKQIIEQSAGESELSSKEATDLLKRVARLKRPLKAKRWSEPLAQLELLLTCTTSHFAAVLSFKQLTPLLQEELKGQMSACASDLDNQAFLPE